MTRGPPRRDDRITGVRAPVGTAPLTLGDASSRQEGAEPGPEVGPAGGQLDGRPQVVELLADVVAALVEHVAVDGSASRAAWPMASVSWISPPSPGSTWSRCVEDLGREHVAAHDGQVRRARRPASASRPTPMMRPGASAAAGSAAAQP